MKVKIILILCSISLLANISIANENKEVKTNFNLPKQQIEFNNIFNKYVNDLQSAMGILFFLKINSLEFESKTPYAMYEIIDKKNMDEIGMLDLNKHYNKKINDLLKEGNIKNWIFKIKEVKFNNYLNQFVITLKFINNKNNEILIYKIEDFEVLIMLTLGIETTGFPKNSLLYKQIKSLKKGKYVKINGNLKSYDFLKMEKLGNDKKMIASLKKGKKMDNNLLLSKNWFYPNSLIVKRIDKLGNQAHMIILSFFLTPTSIQKIN